MKELSNQIYKSIKDLCSEGDDLLLLEKFDLALEKYNAAWNLLPVSQFQWDAATWIITAIGDAHFMSENYQFGFDSFQYAMHCPNAIGNPFLHLRLGQCSFELGNFNQAADELVRAYAIQGEEIFKDENQKYFDFLKHKLPKDFNE